MKPKEAQCFYEGLKNIVNKCKNNLSNDLSKRYECMHWKEKERRTKNYGKMEQNIFNNYELEQEQGRFNNYVTLKLSFLAHLPPTITLCPVYSRDHSCVMSRTAQTPPPLLPNKKRNFRI